MGEKDVNPICRDCMNFDMFGKGCWVYWEGKKFCTMKVVSREDAEERSRMTK